MNKAAVCKTFEELNAAYPDRSCLSHKEEVEYVKAAFDLYEAGGFLEKFDTPYEDMEEYIGMAFTVDGRMTEQEADLDCLPKWHITFENGEKNEAYPEEICRLEV